MIDLSTKQPHRSSNSHPGDACVGPDNEAGGESSVEPEIKLGAESLGACRLETSALGLETAIVLLCAPYLRGSVVEEQSKAGSRIGRGSFTL